ncbi:MAG: hypothetical protein P4L40_16055 [Terracidiphilus sp.]|nr:hypothetical protein [Terracidiphilus sp.]
MISSLRARFNAAFEPEKYAELQRSVGAASGTGAEFRLAETPVFVERDFLERLAKTGVELLQSLLANDEYLAAARKAIPKGYCVADQTAFPNFLTADFALVREHGGALAPRLVEIQAFPSVFGFQAVLSEAYRAAFNLPDCGYLLGGLDDAGYWDLLQRTIVGNCDPETVVLMEVDPWHQKTRPDFAITADRLGIAVVDITAVEPNGDRLVYRNESGQKREIRRVYNRAIVDELIARKIKLAFDLERKWNVEWAGHPNWYFLVSKFAVPWLVEQRAGGGVVPPAVFLEHFLAGDGRERLRSQGVELASRRNAANNELLLKPLFGFAGKGIQFGPSLADLEAIPAAERHNYLLQRRMQFERTVDTPYGMTQPEFRILYLWPDGGELKPVITLVRLGRGRMMGVDHNRDLEWVGASAALYPIMDSR